MENKTKNKPKASLTLTRKSPIIIKDHNEAGFDNDNDRAQEFQLTEKAKQKLLTAFYKKHPQSTTNASLIESNHCNYIKNEISITLSVQDIYKLINKQELINYYKVLFLYLYCILTSLLLQVLFFIVISYLRPTLMTNKYTCFDQNTLNYIECHVRDMCSCSSIWGCVSFCYNDTYTNCTEKFKHESLNSTNSFISHFNQKVYIKYTISTHENKSIFQKINHYFCISNYILFHFTLLFVIGGIIGYCLFGPIADVNGKKIAISILLIALIIVIIPICVLAYYELAANFIAFIIVWSFIYFILGVVLLPLNSCLFLYVLENYPLSEELKGLNVHYIRIEALAFCLYYIYDYFIKNIAYALFFIEAYLIIFAIVFILYYIETPRYYSERRSKHRLKAKAIRFYTNPWSVSYTMTNKKEKTFDGFKRIALINKIIPSEEKAINKSESRPNNDNNIKSKDKRDLANDTNDNDNDNKNKIELNFYKSTYEIIKKKYRSNKHIDKYYYLMLFCFVGISVCYYAIILSLIKNLMNPNMPIDEIQKVNVCAYMFLCILIVVPLLNKLIMECFSFEGFIPYLLILFTIMACVFDIPELNNNSDRISFYGNDIEKNVRLKNLYVEGTGFWLIAWIYHIFEFLLLRQAPTLYRTIFYFNQKAVCQLSILFCIISVCLLDTPVLIAGIFGFVVALLFFVVRINWKYEMFEENKDIEDKLKMNSKNSQL